MKTGGLTSSSDVAVPATSVLHGKTVHVTTAMGTTGALTAVGKSPASVAVMSGALSVEISSAKAAKRKKSVKFNQQRGCV